MMALLLTACGGGGGENRPAADPAQELALTIRGEYLAAAGCTAALEVTADYGRRVYTYTLEVTVAGEETSLTVTAPETAAGVTARLSGGESWLEYDGAVLETGPLTNEGLTPLGAIPTMLEGARSGFMDSCALETLGERDTLRVFFRDPSRNAGEGTEMTLWFDAGDHTLVQGEISSDGYRVILCTFERFALTEG